MQFTNSYAINGNAGGSLAPAHKMSSNRKCGSDRMLYGQRLALLFNFISVNVSCPLPCPEASWKRLLYPKHLQQPLMQPGGVRCHPGFDLVGAASSLCLWVICGPVQSSCRGMQTANSHCLLIVCFSALDLNSNGPVILCCFWFHGPRTTEREKL